MGRSSGRGHDGLTLWHFSHNTIIGRKAKECVRARDLHTWYIIAIPIACSSSVPSLSAVYVVKALKVRPVSCEPVTVTAAIVKVSPAGNLPVGLVLQRNVASGV